MRGATGKERQTPESEEAHLQLLGVADAVVEHVDLRGKEGDAGRTATGTRPPAPALRRRPPWEMGLTSYFCCFSFSIRSNFSDSSWWIQSDSSWAFSLVGQTGCQGEGRPLSAQREPPKAIGPDSEWGITAAISLISEAKIFKVNGRKGFINLCPLSPHSKFLLP